MYVLKHEIHCLRQVLQANFPSLHWDKSFMKCNELYFHRNDATIKNLVPPKISSYESRFQCTSDKTYPLDGGKFCLKYYPRAVLREIPLPLA